MPEDVVAQRSDGGTVGVVPPVAPPASQVAPAAPAPPPPRPHGLAVIIGIVLVVGSLVAAAFLHWSDGFVPRVKTIDALAGLTIAALIVDRLLTFVPPLGARRAAAERAADLRVLRIGYGAVIGAALVCVTDLRAVAALTSESQVTIDAGVDRMIAVLAVAGGVAGIARLLSGLNPKPATDATAADAAEKAAPANSKPDADDFPPTRGARGLGVAAVLAAAALALLAVNDTEGIALLGPEQQADGTIALVVRFGTVLLAAAVIQQLLEWFVAPWVLERNKPVLTGAVAVVLGVLAALLIDLFLLHNIGFFGATESQTMKDALAGSTDAERWLDTFLTGLVIAAGTKPLHDISSRLRKAQTA